MTRAFSSVRSLGWLLVAVVFLAGGSAPAFAQESQARGTGWLCGVVLDEAGGFASEVRRCTTRPRRLCACSAKSASV